MRTGPLLLVTTAVVIASTFGSAQTASAGARIGMADQKASFFADQRFVDLGLRDVRYYLPWDVLRDPLALGRADAWLAAAKLAGATPLLTIDRSQRRARAAIDPTPAVLAAQVRAWRARWPGQVRTISTWNEANINKRPALVASWWGAIRRACPGCTVLGADLVDAPNAVSWARRFVRAARRAPAVWGLHAYLDANTQTTRRTEAFLRGVRGQVWLTETGGVVNRRTPRFAFSSCGPAHAARATTFLLEDVAELSPRISRIYLYHWSSSSFTDSWDSAFVDALGRSRPALDLLRAHLGFPEEGAATLASPGGCRRAPAKR